MAPPNKETTVEPPTPLSQEHLITRVPQVVAVELEALEVMLLPTQIMRRRHKQETAVPACFG
jgi:hypothetical protein